MKEVDKYVVAFDTGEVLDTIYKGDRLMKVSAKTIEFLQQNVNVNKGKKYTMVIDKAFNIIANLGLTSSAYDVLMVMLSHLGYGIYSGYVIKLENKQFKGFMNGKEIMSLTTCSDSTFKKAIKQLEELKIIKKVKAIKGVGNNFIVNPFIATHSNTIPKELFEMFEDSVFNYTKEKNFVNKSELNKRIRDNKETIIELEKIKEKRDKLR